jgi:phosphate transport system protein
MRNKFDEQILELNDAMIEMGTMIENAIAGAVTAIMDNDTDLANQIVDTADEMHQKEREIEAMCLKLLLQQQPVARDLRTISSALKMITDMRRIGIQAGDICEVKLTSESLEGGKLPDYIKQIAKATIEMVDDSIEAFVKKDLELAYKVAALDTKVDNLFKQIKSDLIAAIRNNSQGSEQAIDILMIAKYLEKIGDHANNISEWVAFSITGRHRK